MKIISRKEAKEQGLKRYFTGKPCKRGHIAQRSLLNGNCVECLKENQQRYILDGRAKIYAEKYRENNKEKLRIRSEKYYKNNKEKVKATNLRCYYNNWEKRLLSAEKYRENNKEKLRIRGEKYYAKNKKKLKKKLDEYRKNNKEKYLLHLKEWRLNNRDKIKKSWSKWNKNNPGKNNEYKKKWRQNNPEASRRAGIRESKFLSNIYIRACLNTKKSDNIPDWLISLKRQHIINLRLGKQLKEVKQ